MDNKKKLIHYNFFDDPLGNGQDAIYGLDIPLMKLVNIFKSAAQRYGTERRVILLHGPVGSSKSTIARLLKAGLEAYSKRPEGRSWELRLEPGPSPSPSSSTTGSATRPGRPSSSRSRIPTPSRRTRVRVDSWWTELPGRFRKG